jgi:hypothetical protein
MFFQSSLLTDHSRSHPAFAIAHVDLLPTGEKVDGDAAPDMHPCQAASTWFFL